MKKRQIIIVAIAIGIVAAGVLLFKMQTAEKEDVAKQKVFSSVKYVNAEEAVYKDHQSIISGFGRLRSMKKIELYAEVGGVMIDPEQRFKVGNSFKEGDLLLKVDSEEARLNLFSMKSSYMNLLTSSLADIKADFPDEFRKWENYLENFVIENPIPDLPEIGNNKMKYFLSNRQIFSQYYSIKNAEVKLAKYDIKAPFSGALAMSMVENRTYIRPGQKLGDFASVGSYELELNIPVNDISFVNVGDVAKITAQSREGEWNGKITRIAKNIDSKTQTVNVFLNVYGKDLKDGMYMKAEIDGVIIKNAIKIPRKALVNSKFVFTIQDSALGKSPVELIKLTDKEAYLKGVDEGKIIITDAVANAEVGMKIKRINN